MQQQTLETIVRAFPISNEEFFELEKEFGKLAYYASWQLKKKNSQNSVTNDIEDDTQEMSIAVIRAGSYYKRQTYIEDCFAALKVYLKDKLLLKILEELEALWFKRKSHGAGRQKFGDFQEKILEMMVQHHVPDVHKPDRNRKLKIDRKFIIYCKRIVWNQTKFLGKQITREKSIRNGLVSIDKFTNLA